MKKQQYTLESQAFEMYSMLPDPEIVSLLDGPGEDTLPRKRRLPLYNRSGSQASHFCGCEVCDPRDIPPSEGD